MSVKPTLASPPKWIEPYTPTLISKPMKGPNWRHEIKGDGYRISIVMNERAVKVWTRNGLDRTEKFPATASSCAGPETRQPDHRGR
jgi:bifunctional non-homologous end joining protein LigD